MKRVCICGGGSLGHVVAGWLSAKGKAKVDVLTSKPHLWHDVIHVSSDQGEISGRLDRVDSEPARLIPDADVVILCYPGFMIGRTLESICPYLKPDAYVGSIFSSTGFFFEAQIQLPRTQPIWGFQRVPFISRVKDYGSSANILGYKPCYHIAVEHVDESQKRAFADLIQDWFERPVHLLKNFYESSLTNSNPLLHTSRLYAMFGRENDGRVYPEQIRFYEDWNDEASEILIKMDEEFFRILDVLPVRKGYLPRILDYYESHDAASLTRKISSISGFKGILSPMLRTQDGWIPDFSSRYFTEDFPYGLKYIWQLAHDHNIPTPVIDEVYQWGISKL